MNEKKYIDAAAWLERCSKSWMNYNLAKKIINEAPAAPVFGQWIPAEQPPEMADEYIVMIDGATAPTVLFYDVDDEGAGVWFEAVEDITNFYSVTHWMALPEAPEVAVRRERESDLQRGNKQAVCKCKACGAEIVFVTMQGSGKRMPCDAELIHAVKDDAAKTFFVLPGGIVKRGRAGRHPNGEADFVGYRSHFESCPQADGFRKRGQGDG